MHPHGVSYATRRAEWRLLSARSWIRVCGGAGSQVYLCVVSRRKTHATLTGEPSSKAWLYHSHVSGDAETNAGLVGFIIATDGKRARPDGTPSDTWIVEMAALFA